MPISANNHKTALPGLLPAGAAGSDPADALCACGHPRDEHDAISVRYCDATIAGGLQRGCVCHAESGAYPGRM